MTVNMDKYSRKVFHALLILAVTAESYPLCIQHVA